MKLIASIFGIGRIKGGGSIAAALTAVLWLWGKPLFGLQLLLIVVVFFLGIVAGNKVEPDWGKDSSKVVIDEVAGMLLSLFLVPATLWHVAVAFVLFRFFDIVKPLGVRRMEFFNGGTGVMMDDMLAGLYANILMQLLVHFQIIPGS